MCLQQQFNILIHGYFMTFISVQELFIKVNQCPTLRPRQLRRWCRIPNNDFRTPHDAPWWHQDTTWWCQNTPRWHGPDTTWWRQNTTQWRQNTPPTPPEPTMSVNPPWQQSQPTTSNHFDPQKLVGEVGWWHHNSSNFYWQPSWRRGGAGLMSLLSYY